MATDATVEKRLKNLTCNCMPVGGDDGPGSHHLQCHWMYAKELLQSAADQAARARDRHWSDTVLPKMAGDPKPATPVEVRNLMLDGMEDQKCGHPLRCMDQDGDCKVCAEIQQAGRNTRKTDIKALGGLRYCSCVRTLKSLPQP